MNADNIENEENEDEDSSIDDIDVEHRIESNNDGDSDSLSPNPHIEQISQLQAINDELQDQVEFLERDNNRLIHENLRLKASSSPSNTSTGKIKPSAAGMARRPSTITMAMKPRASVGHLLDSLLNENSVLSTNIHEFLSNLKHKHGSSSREHNINHDEEEQMIYEECINCMMTLFHQRVTLASSLAINHHKQRMHNISMKVMHHIMNMTQHVELQCELLPFPLKWLYKSFPDHSETVEGRGWLPLHWYLTTPHPTIDDVQYLYQHYGEDAFEEAVSPLSVLACNAAYNTTSSSSMSNCDALEELLRLRPHAAYDQDADGSYSIMHACATDHASSTIIDRLYRANPQSIQHADHFGCYAIHYACYFGNLLSIRYLIDHQPACGSMISGNGALPLHEAVQNLKHCNLELITMVHQQHPAAIKMKDHQGALPLHYAARSADIQVVRYLYDAYPEAISIEDQEELTPIHYSSQRKDKNVQVIEYLAKYSKASPSKKKAADSSAPPVQTSRLQDLMSSWTKKS